jgi:putative ribosome biogenesis GTPase RsgA
LQFLLKNADDLCKIAIPNAGYTMVGSMMDDDWEPTSSNGVPRTLVLFGRTGNGKSVTGNSILGEKVFKSKSSSSGVTDTCELQSTVLRDGHIINVIDTPGIVLLLINILHGFVVLKKYCDISKLSFPCMLVDNFAGLFDFSVGSDLLAKKLSNVLAWPRMASMQFL